MTKHFIYFPDSPATREWEPVSFETRDINPDPPVSALTDWHRAYFCPTCSKVWAKWETEGAEVWFPVSRACREACRRHNLERPGSLLMDKLYDLRILPWELLVREFMLGEVWQIEIGGSVGSIG